MDDDEESKQPARMTLVASVSYDPETGSFAPDDNFFDIINFTEQQETVFKDRTK